MTKDPKIFEPIEIEEALRNNTQFTPDVYARWRTRLTAEWGYYSGQLEEILKRKPTIWLEIRKQSDIKSDSQASKIWEASSDGQTEMIYRLRMKRLEKLISSLRQLIEISMTDWNLTNV